MMDAPLPSNLAELGITRVVAFDYETYYSTEDGYSLSKMTTEQYVRDSRFQIICVTATVNGRDVYEAWGHEASRQLLLDLGVEKPGVLSVAHNARFDGCVGEMAAGIRFNMLVCTQHMMRVTGVSRIITESLESLANFLRSHGYAVPVKGNEVKHANGLRLENMSEAFKLRYMEYCKTDTIILFAAAMVLLPQCPVDTLRASSMTLQMYTRPAIRLNKKLLEKYYADIMAERQETLAGLAEEYSCSTVKQFVTKLKSRTMLAQMLRDLGVNPPMKESPKKTATLRKNLQDEAWVKKKKNKKFLAQLEAQGTTWDEWAESPVMDYAFSAKDTEFADLALHWDERVAALVTARLENNSSLAETRALRFIEASDRGLFVIALQYARARTHRYGADDGYNQQNLPKHKGGKELRYSMEAPDGFEIGGADSSQIEARLLAYAAQETSLLNIFASGADPYCYMAERIYGVPAEEIRKWAKLDREEVDKLCPDDKIKQAVMDFRRFMGKKVVLGSGYQMSGKKFALTLRQDKVMLKPSKEQVTAWLRIQPSTVLSNKKVLKLEYNQFLQEFHDKEARRINWIYRSSHPKIKAFWSTCDWVLGQMCQGKQGYFGGVDGKLFYYDGKHEIFGAPAPGIMLPNGEWIVYPYLKTFKEEETGYTKFVYQDIDKGKLVENYIHGGKLTENIIQALAFVILTWQAVRIHAVLPVKGNVHDEWFSVYPKELRPKAKAVYETAMRTVPPFVPGLPLNCEFSCGPSYGHM